MKFNIFKSQKQSNLSPKNEGNDHYNESVNFYYTNLINSLILFTYNSEQLEKMTPILIDPLTELYEELQYAFTPVCFETIFRNEFIDEKFKDELLTFKAKVEKIPNNIWDWKSLDTNERWIELRNNADVLLTTLGINSRIYDDKFTTIISSTGKILKNGN